MGFRIRKSFNLGDGFRVTLSKTGIGYSWGVPGQLITKTARGSIRRTYSIPGTGIGYVAESSSSNKRIKFSQKKNTVVSPQKTVTGKTYDANEYDQMHNIESSDIKNFKPVEYKKFLRRLSFILFSHRITNVMIALIIIYLIYSINDYLIISCIGLFLKILLWFIGRIKIEYELDNELKSTFQEYVTSWNYLTKSHYIWQIVQMAGIKNLKKNAGAENAVERKNMKIKVGVPWYLKSNLKFPILKFRKETLILLPDKVLLVHKWHAGAVSQKNVNIFFDTAKMIEDEYRPLDSELIQHQWLHVNKDGSRDKRYVDNKQLPVYKYGKIDISSPEGIKESFLVSNEKLSSKLKESYEKYKKEFCML